MLPNGGNFQLFEPALYFQRGIDTELYDQNEIIIIF